MHRFHDVRDAQISPDGKWVAYTVNTVDSAADKSDTDVWITSWDGKQHLRMTTSTESESAPRWSPDGRWLSFLSSRPGKAKGNQVWLLDRNGGEAQQFTDVKGRLTAYDWSPDAKKLLLVMADRDPNDPADDERPAGAAPGSGHARQSAQADRHRPLQVQAGHPGLSDAAGRQTLSLRCGEQESRGADRRRRWKRHRPPGLPTASGSRSWAARARTRSATTPRTSS